MKLLLLKLMLPAVGAWSSACQFPKVDWFMLDEGRGISGSQSVAGMGIKTYVGGYTAGNLTLVALTATGDKEPTATITSSGYTKDLYISETNAEGVTTKVWNMVGTEPCVNCAGPGSGSPSGTVSFHDVQGFRDGKHLGVAAYFLGNLTLIPTITLINPLPTDTGDAVLAPPRSS